MKIDFQVSGIDGLERKLRGSSEDMRKKLAAALHAEALQVQLVSMRRTPVDTGALRASHITRPAEDKANEISVKIEVGGPAAPYAVYVHENPDAHHPVGQYDFLGSALREAAPGMGSRLAKSVS